MEKALEQNVQEKNPFQNTSVLFRGSVVLPREINPTTEGANKYLDSLFERVNKGAKADFVFDIDGVLTEISLETAANPKLLDTWVAENPEAIAQFKHRVKTLKNTGNFRMSICTGRGWDYAKRVADILFPEDALDYAIVEGGALVASKPQEGKNWELRAAGCVDHKSLENLDKFRSTITDHVLGNMGGFLEPKKIRLTLNPPQKMLKEYGKDAGKIFKEQIIKYMKEELMEKNPDDKNTIQGLIDNITNTPTTVEIMPSGINKLEALQEMAGENIKIFLGDANTDKPGMKISDINIAPDNAEADIKNFVKGEEPRNTFGLLPSEKDLKGVNEAMDLIYIHYRRIKLFPPIEK